jgi:hypothetical protein
MKESYPAFQLPAEEEITAVIYFYFVFISTGDSIYLICSFGILGPSFASLIWLASHHN